MKLPRRYTIEHDYKVDYDKIYVPKIRFNERNLDARPDGMWYACGNGWYNFAKKEFPDTAMRKYISKVDFNKSSLTDINNPDKNKLLVIKNKDDFDEFEDIYGKEIKITKEHRRSFNENVVLDTIIDWKKVSKDYAGIELCPHIKSRHNHVWYTSWPPAGIGCIWNVPAVLKNVTPIYVKKNNKYVEF